MSEQPRPPLVQFETRAIIDHQAKEEAGRMVYKNVVYAMVTTEGGKNVFEDEVENWLNRQRENADKGRIPYSHLEYFEKAYDRFLKGQEMVLNGTDLKMWPVIDPARLKICQQAGVYTVEGLSEANEDTLKRIGMGARDLKQMAKDWLSQGDKGKVNSELASLRSQLDSAMDIISQLKEENEKIAAAEKKKKGS